MAHQLPPAAGAEKKFSLNAPGWLLWSDLPQSRNLIELVELAEAIGYSELWYTDVRFVYDCYMGLTLAAKHSRRMLIGPGVSDPYSRHPALIAMAMATLDELSGGRVQIGLGTGAGGLAQMGINQEKPVRALREAIELIRAMLTGERVNYVGSLFQLQNAGLGFEPVRATVPIFIATHSPQVLRLSGRLADGVLLGNMGRREAIVNAIRILREAEASAGRPPGTVSVHLRLETCISDDGEAALDAVRRRFAVRLINSYPRWRYLDELGIEPTAELKAAAETKDHAAVAAQLSADDVRASTLAGSVQEVAQHLVSILTPEVDRVTIRPLAAGGEHLSQTVTRFVKDVWPRVTAAVRAGAAT